MKNRKNLSQRILKSKWTWLVLGLLFVLGLGYGMGNTNAAVPLDEKKVTYEEIDQEITKKEEELASVLQEIEAKQKEVDAKEKEKERVLADIKKRQDEFDEAMEISKNKEDVLKEIKAHETDLKTKQDELSTIESSISAKEQELAQTDQLIKEKEEAPIELSAGTFYVGQDVPVGRYKATPNGRGSNFVVYNDSGGLEVNTILGGSHGEPEYIFFVFDGYVIESGSSVNLVLVE